MNPSLRWFGLKTWFGLILINTTDRRGKNRIKSDWFLTDFHQIWYKLFLGFPNTRSGSIWKNDLNIVCYRSIINISDLIWFIIPQSEKYVRFNLNHFETIWAQIDPNRIFNPNQFEWIRGRYDSYWKFRLVNPSPDRFW